MRKEKILQVNGKIEISVNNDDTIYKSIIQDVGQDYFTIDTPMANNLSLFLKPNDKVQGVIVTKLKRYLFVTEVLGNKEEEISMYILQKPRKVKSQDRRNFVRIETYIPVTYEIISDQNYKYWEDFNISQQAYAVDLSGGGIQLLLDQPLSEGNLVILDIPLSSKGNDLIVKVLGTVVRNEYRNVEGNEHYRVAVEFKDISERKQDMIIQYVFNLMRKNIHIRDD